VLVIDCTTTGAPPPILVPAIFTAMDERRGQMPVAELLEFIGACVAEILIL